MLALLYPEQGFGVWFALRGFAVYLFFNVCRQVPRCLSRMWATAKTRTLHSVGVLRRHTMNPFRLLGLVLPRVFLSLSTP
jgi:hypothetical protein